MRNRLLGLVTFVALALPAAAAVNCSSSSGGPTGTGGATAGSGSGGTVGGGSGGSGGSCSNVTACGGDVAGVWTASSSCLTVNGQLDLAAIGAGCASAVVTGSLQVTGTLTLKSDGTYQDDTTTTGQEQFALAKSCLVISSTQTDCPGAASIIQSIGYQSLTCTSAAGGGCTCMGTVHQTGGFGVLSLAPPTSNMYSTAGNVLTLSGDIGDVTYSYCASGGTTLTVTPSNADPAVSGTIVLQKSATSSGAGGSTSSGGTTGGAGGAGSGGTTGMAGRSGSGGATGMAGRSGGSGGAGGASSATGGSSGTAMGPCDIYKSAGNPCVAAHSTVRALFGAYSGKLYQVRNSAGTTKDILTVAPGGAADGPSQDAFCSGTTCVITVVYDQSGKGNDLWYQGSTQVPGSPSSQPAKATSESLTLNGQKVYSLYINPHNSYWVDASKSGIALGAQPEGMYMVTSGKHFNGGCCFDYGNSEVDRSADGAGAMDAINFSSIMAWGEGAGSGPWVMADLEYGVFSREGDSGATKVNSNDPTQTSTYVTAILKNNGTSEYALRGGNAASGPLGTYYKGMLPGGWSPMKKQGAIVLGSGGDCCKPSGGANDSDGTFYEGCIVTGYPTDATEDAVQANIVAAGYGK